MIFYRERTQAENRQQHKTASKTNTLEKSLVKMTRNRKGEIQITVCEWKGELLAINGADMELVMLNLCVSLARLQVVFKCQSVVHGARLKSINCIRENVLENGRGWLGHQGHHLMPTISSLLLWKSCPVDSGFQTWAAAPVRRTSSSLQ